MFSLSNLRKQASAKGVLCQRSSPDEELYYKSDIVVPYGRATGGSETKVPFRSMPCTEDLFSVSDQRLVYIKGEGL